MQVLYSPPLTGRKLLQAPAVDLTNATTVASIMQIAAQLVPTQADQATTAALIQGLTPDQLAAVGTAVANLNADVASSSDAATIEKSQYYAQTEVTSFAACLALVSSIESGISNQKHCSNHPMVLMACKPSLLIANLPG